MFTMHKWHKIKMKEQYYVTPEESLIRIIGDPVLHQAGILFPSQPTDEEKKELDTQIECAKSVLIQTGGAGIAANQCAQIAKPYRFTIVGVFYNIPEHAARVGKRYPNVKFPQAVIMINPVINSISQERQQFNHACLSVPCSNRCAVFSPSAMTISYQDYNELSLNTVRWSDVDAIVLWHELMHILEGKTYMDIIFESLPADDFLQLHAMVKEELHNRAHSKNFNILDLAGSPFHLSVHITAMNSYELDKMELKAVLAKMSEETLKGLFKRANALL